LGGVVKVDKVQDAVPKKDLGFDAQKEDIAFVLDHHVCARRKGPRGILFCGLPEVIKAPIGKELLEVRSGAEGKPWLGEPLNERESKPKVKKAFHGNRVRCWKPRPVRVIEKEGELPMGGSTAEDEGLRNTLQASQEDPKVDLLLGNLHFGAQNALVVNAQGIAFPAHHEAAELRIPGLPIQDHQKILESWAELVVETGADLEEVQNRALNLRPKGLGKGELAGGKPLEGKEGGVAKADLNAPGFLTRNVDGERLGLILGKPHKKSRHQNHPSFRELLHTPPVFFSSRKMSQRESDYGHSKAKDTRKLRGRSG